MAYIFSDHLTAHAPTSGDDEIILLLQGNQPQPEVITCGTYIQRHQQPPVIEYHLSRPHASRNLAASNRGLIRLNSVHSVLIQSRQTRSDPRQTPPFPMSLGAIMLNASAMAMKCFLVIGHPHFVSGLHFRIRIRIHLVSAHAT